MVRKSSGKEPEGCNRPSGMRIEFGCKEKETSELREIQLKTFITSSNVQNVWILADKFRPFNRISAKTKVDTTAFKLTYLLYSIFCFITCCDHFS